MVIGGGAIYRALLERADRIFLTQVETSLDGDATFPDLDPGEWTEVSREYHPADERHAFGFTILVLDRSG
jgi:dihydrofolate reductase